MTNIDNEVEDKAALDDYYDSRGKCCGTCINSTYKTITSGDHFLARGRNEIPWCYKVDHMISITGYCNDDNYKRK